MATGLQVTRVVLLGTTNSREGHETTLADCATGIRTALISDEGLCGARFPASAVSVVKVASPVIHDASAALAEWLGRNRATEVMVTCGSGAFALSAGAVCAALETHHAVRIAHIDAPMESYTLNQPTDPDLHLKSWLLRHRFWDALTEADPANATLWQILAARHAADSALMERLVIADHPELSSLAKRWPTVQAAIAERAGRGEAADYGLLRAWYGEQLRRCFGNEEGKLSPDTRDKIGRLVDALVTRADGNGHLSAHIRQAARSLNNDLGSACVRMIRDFRLTALYTNAATHQAHLQPEHRTQGPLPPTLLAAIQSWENGDPAVQLIARAGEPAWPVVGSGDVLALVAVGLDKPGVQTEDRHTAEAILAELWERRERLLRRGILRVRLLASPESLERAHRIAQDITAVHTDVDVRVIEGIKGGLDQVREAIVDALSSEAQPTGRTGSGSLRDVDEIILFLNPGPPLTNYGMIAAGVAWSLIAACPLSMMELTRVNSVTQVRGGRPVLARLGADRMLARLAISAIRRLDLRTARRLLERGSTRLQAVLPALEQLEAGLYGPCPREWRRTERIALARQRIRLIAHACSDHPGLAAYLTVTALRPVLFSWSTWKAMRTAYPALDQLSLLANQSEHSHALDRRPPGSGRRHNNRPHAGAHQPLIQAARQLGGTPETDTRLINLHKTVITTIESIFPEAG
ncbi:hypothetical protein HCN51_52660 [Nonomuraea sp. FMUSA5-5]|uniref:Uncharacterized protein n=1 Tax=Nonomuraea composti TaxID=2720023 RepID=A0ABX1BRW1_9ACTN|nr:hypothetical protein [Nonomuraea sp. FMUSA5-5]NJP97986.1 hypothetical protein [Nonomuraea sp. FMUSA5-5]